MATNRKKQIASLLLIFVVTFTSVFTIAPMSVNAASGVRIGQATNTEKGGIRGGKAGDQTGGECAIANWSYGSKSGSYNHWKYVIRSKEPTVAKKLASLMVDACNNDHIGYDQKAPDRFSLYDEAQALNWNIAAITNNCETTCSSVVCVCLNAVGIGVPRYWDASCVYSDLKKTGRFYIFKDKAHTSKTIFLEPGDILVSPGHHTAMVVESPNACGTEKGYGEAALPASSTEPSTLKAITVRKPESIVQGNGFSIVGTVTSNYAISKVTVSIHNAAGTAVIKKSAKPKSTWYSIGGLDAQVKFGTLAVGTYTYRITASDTKLKNAIVHENTFVVEAAPVEETVLDTLSNAADGQTTASKITAASLSEPSTVYQGIGHAVRGKITSTKKLTSVTAVIKDVSGNTVCMVSEQPGKKKFNMKTMDARLTFSKLAVGTYRYVVSASDDTQTVELLNKKFKVKAAKNSKASSKKSTSKSSAKAVVTISGVRAPSALKKGKKFSIKGTIKSNKTIKSVKVSVVKRSGGKTVLSATAKPGKKKYSIKKLDKKIKFAKLKKGKYTFKVQVKVSSKWKTVYKKNFKVK